MDAYTTPSAGPSRPNTRITLPPMMIFPTNYHPSLNEYQRLPSFHDQERTSNFGPTSADSYEHRHPFHTQTPPSDFDHESGNVIRSEMPYHDSIIPSGPGPQSFANRYPTQAPSYPTYPTLSIDLLLAAAHATTELPFISSQPNYTYTSPATSHPVWQHSLNHAGTSEAPISPHTPRTALSAPYEAGPSSGPYAAYRGTERVGFQQASYSTPSEAQGSASFSPASIPPPQVDSSKASQASKKKAPAKRGKTKSTGKAKSTVKPKQGKKKRTPGYVRPIIINRKRVGQRLLDMLTNAPIPSKPTSAPVVDARCFPFAEMDTKLRNWYGLSIEWPANSWFGKHELKSTRRMRVEELIRLNATLDTGLVRIRLADNVLKDEPNRANEFSYPSDGSAADQPQPEVAGKSKPAPKPAKKPGRKKARFAEVEGDQVASGSGTR